MTQRPNRREFLTGWFRRPRRPVVRQRDSGYVAPAASPPTYVRPPGARDEDAFIATCTRGGDCAQACPIGAIVPLGPAYGEATAGTPALLPRANACILCKELPCVAACPSGALQMVPIERVQMGTAHLHQSRCLAVKGENCDECIKVCPVGSRALRLERGVPHIDASVCSGCGRCEQACPTEPPAITVTPREFGRIRPN